MQDKRSSEDSRERNFVCMREMSIKRIDNRSKKDMRGAGTNHCLFNLICIIL